MAGLSGLTNLQKPKIYLMSHNRAGIVSLKRYIVNKTSRTRFSEDRRERANPDPVGLLMSKTVENQHRILAILRTVLTLHEIGIS